MGTRSTRIARTLGAALACLAVSGLPAVAAPGGWGPARVPYVNGVVCNTAQGSTALVSWPSATTDPGFASAPVTGPPTGGTGTFGLPAVLATQTQPLPDSSDAAALAYLIAAHGRDPQPGVIGDVAALVSSRTVSNPLADACLAARTGGADAAVAAGLWSEAQRLAGPYTVRVSTGAARLILGSSTTLTARAVSAQGAPVPGLVVTFTTSDPGAAVQSPTATTDLLGDATTRLTLAAGSPVTSVHIDASVSAPIGLVQLSAPGAVPLVTPDGARTVTTAAAVPVDTTADPEIVGRANPTLLLPGGVVHYELHVSGMRGHNGTALAQLVGPLPFVKGVGCGRYSATDWRTPAAAVSSAAYGIVGDGASRTGTATLTAAGCYRVVGRVTTSNATPNVARTGRSGDVITVAPLRLSQTAGGNGLALAGPLTTTMRVSGPTPAALTGLTGELLGPRLAAYGICPTSGWGDLPSRATLTAADQQAGPSVTLSSPPQSRGDCYAFRVRGTITLPGIGSIPVSVAPGQARASELVLAPAAAVTNLSSSAVTPGGRLSATVSVTGTLTQQATLRIQLRRVPDTWRGCYGLDWAAATVVAQRPSDPVLTTHGDDSYTLRTPPVPTEGCWAPVPVLSFRTDPHIVIRGLPADGTTAAFTALAPDRATVRPDNGIAFPYATQRLLFAFVLTVVLVTAAVLTTCIAAQRSRLDAETL